MLICFTSDLHGDRRLYSQLEELLRRETPDLLILGGDLLRDGDGDDPMAAQVALTRRDLLPRLATWRTFAPRMAIACLAGNHEWVGTRDVFQAEHDAGRLVLLSARVWPFNGVRFLGYACTPPTPHTVKDFERRDLPEDGEPAFEGVVWDPSSNEVRDAALVEHFRRHPSMAEDLAQFETPAAPWIFVAHAPPYDSRLDRLPGLPYPIGSRAVRQFIEQRQPAVSLHGHVHESPMVTGHFSDTLGRTLCINPGQAHEHLHAVLFDAARPAETLRHTVLK
jgi:Icc-related predicted phosphoesterase